MKQFIKDFKILFLCGLNIHRWKNIHIGEYPKPVSILNQKPGTIQKISLLHKCSRCCKKEYRLTDVKI